MMPLDAALLIVFIASVRALPASSLFPDAIASSTFFMTVFMSLFTALLRSLLFSACLAFFKADGFFFGFAFAGKFKSSSR